MVPDSNGDQYSMALAEELIWPLYTAVKETPLYILLLILAGLVALGLLGVSSAISIGNVVLISSLTRSSFSSISLRQSLAQCSLPKRPT